MSNEQPTGSLAWFASSYSGPNGGECVEVAIDWRKSSYSGTEGGECVEVACGNGAIHVRDSKDCPGPVLTFTPEAWTAFLSFASADEQR